MRLMAAKRSAPQVLREQRLHPRARFLNPGRVELEAGRGYAEGEIVDLSRTGAQVRLQTPLAPGRRVTGEFSLGSGVAVPFAGIVVNLRDPRGNAPGVGIRFDGPAAGEWNAVIDDVIRKAIARGEDGRALASMVQVITWGNSPKVKVYGALSGHGWRDLLGAVARFGAASLDLSDVTSIDPAGIALCMMASERHGAQVERCSRHVREIMDLAQMCGKLCAGTCLTFSMGARP